MTKYNILIDGKIAFEGLTQEEYFDKTEDLAQQFYNCGVHDPTSLKTEMIEDD